MDSLMTFLLYAAILVAVSMVGAFLPHIKKLRDEEAHLLVALSTGIFLGLLFLMLLPEAMEQVENGGHDMDTAMYAVLAGFVVMMVVEVVMKHRNMCECGCQCCRDAHSHKIASMSSFIGLSVHAACDGLALAATFLAGETVGLMATVGMCIHKFVVLFSLSSTMLLTNMDRSSALRRLLGFSLITPVAGVLFFLVLNGIHVDGFVGIPLAFAAGTFMYVALCDMLPEAFHRENIDVKSFTLIVLGIFLILLMTLAFPHAHIHTHEHIIMGIL